MSQRIRQIRTAAHFQTTAVLTFVHCLMTPFCCGYVIYELLKFCWLPGNLQHTSNEAVLASATILCLQAEISTPPAALIVDQENEETSVSSSSSSIIFLLIFSRCHFVVVSGVLSWSSK